MEDYLKSEDFKKLSYPVKQLTIELLALKKRYEYRKTITLFMYFIIIILGIIYYWINRADYFNMILVPLYVFLCIVLFGKLFDTYEDKYNALLKTLKEYLKKDFCYCPSKCNCQHEYIKSMKEDFKIKLY